MSPGRPNKGAEHLQGVPGGRQEKERLKAILATLAGEISVKEASASLGISESRFADLRKQALQGALEGLTPRPVGRPLKDMENAERKEEAKKAAGVHEKLEREKEALLNLISLGLGQLGVSPQKKVDLATWPHQRGTKKK